MRRCSRTCMYTYVYVYPGGSKPAWRVWVRAYACACVLGSALRVTEWVFVCNHVRQAVMNGVFETERSVEFLGLDQIGNRKTNIP